MSESSSTSSFVDTIVENDELNSYVKNAAAHQPCNRKVVEYYNTWSINYETDLNERIYRGPRICAYFCSILFGEKSDKSTMRVLDVGAGTGLVGELLFKLGFRHIDALEPSKGMASLAQAKEIYSRFYIEPIYSHKNTSINDDEYDLCVAVGSFGEGHIPSSGIRELARVVKPGGVVMIVMRKEYLSTVSEYSDKLEPMMQAMCHENVWTRVSRVEVPNYSFDKTGVVFIFKKS